MDAQKYMPPREIPLESADKTAWFQKMEVHKGVYWYTTDPHSNVDLIPIPVGRVKEIQELNKKGIKVERFIESGESWQKTKDSADLLRSNSLSRFDPQTSIKTHPRHSRKKKKRRFNERSDS